jgi:hypothetical protein
VPVPPGRGIGECFLRHAESISGVPEW